MIPWTTRPVSQTIASLLFIMALAEIGATITLATGFVLIAKGYALRGSLIVSSPCNDVMYGLPFAWRTSLYCHATLDGFSFAIDTLSYMAVGYILIVGVKRMRGGLKVKPSPLLLLAAVYAASIFLLSTAYINGLDSVQENTILSFILSYSAVLVTGLVVFIVSRSPARAHHSDPAQVH